LWILPLQKGTPFSSTTELALANLKCTFTIQPKLTPSKHSFLRSVSGYVAQVSNQGAILAKLSAIIRSGKFCSPPSKIVLVGHSFGSAVSNAVLRSNPDMVEAVLTGASYYGEDSAPSLQAKQMRLANLQNPEKWSKLDGGYAVWVDLYSNIEGYGCLILTLDDLSPN
jgi:pimeloyl-ACP methyl ester carboxylesterase